MAAKSVALFAVLFLGLSAALLVAGSAHGDTPASSSCEGADARPENCMPGLGSGGPAVPGQAEIDRMKERIAAADKAMADKGVAEMAAAEKLAAAQAAAKVQADSKQIAPVAPVAPAVPANQAPTTAVAPAPSVAPAEDKAAAPTSESAWPTFTATASASGKTTAAAPTATADANLKKASATSGGPNLMTILLIMAGVVVIAGGAIAIYMLNRTNAGRH